MGSHWDLPMSHRCICQPGSKTKGHYYRGIDYDAVHIALLHPLSYQLYIVLPYLQSELTPVCPPYNVKVLWICWGDDYHGLFLWYTSAWVVLIWSIFGLVKVSHYRLYQYIFAKILNLIMIAFCYMGGEPMTTTNDCFYYSDFFVPVTCKYVLGFSDLMGKFWYGWTSTSVQVGWWCHRSHTHLGISGTQFFSLYGGPFSMWMLWRGGVINRSCLSQWLMALVRWLACCSDLCGLFGTLAPVWC